MIFLPFKNNCRFLIIYANYLKGLIMIFFGFYFCVKNF